MLQTDTYHDRRRFDSRWLSQIFDQKSFAFQRFQRFVQHSFEFRGFYLVSGKRYNCIDVTAMLTMCLGLIMFTLADRTVQPNFNLYGEETPLLLISWVIKLDDLLVSSCTCCSCPVSMLLPSECSLSNKCPWNGWRFRIYSSQTRVPNSW